MKPAPVADKAALARTGAVVRKRLALDPALHKVAVEEAEIYVAGGFLSAEECSHLIAMIDTVARPSGLLGKEQGGLERSSSSGDVDPSDSFVKMIERRLGDLMGLELAWGETIQGQRYQPGQEFKPHYDWFNTQADYWPALVRSGGQRSWTVMAYLNDVEQGGETEFPLLNIAIKPQAGSLVLWNNALPDGRPNPATMHAGTPVLCGVKYIITKWFRTRRWS